MIRIVTRQIQKLHTEDGQALVFVAMVGLVIFLFFAMTMNVAELVNTKIKNQNVADATALSAAIWQARAMNLVAAANRNMLELWVAGFAALEVCGLSLVGCDLFLCGEIWIDPIYCLSCLIVAGVSCTAAIGFLMDALVNGQFQDVVLDVFRKDLVERDLPHVVRLNYAFKENTASDPVGVYIHFASDEGEELLRSYEPFTEESGEYVLERVGLCEIVVMMIQYVMYLDDLLGGTLGVPDDLWDTVGPVIEDWYSPGGENDLCLNKLSVPPLPPQLDVAAFPLALRTRRSDWSPQNLDSLLSISVATYKAHEPPPALGKGSGPADCAWVAGDTRFACPDARHYAFASAHAYSQSASDFYNVRFAGASTSYPIPYIPFEMDWRPRLFPFEPYPDGAESPYGGQVAYEEIADQIGADEFAEDRLFLLNNELMMNGMHFFLY